MSFTPRGSRDLLVAGVTGVLAILLYPAAFLAGESFFERDLHLDWYPRMEALARCLREGAWPLWDLSLGFGQPLLADPGAQVVYPVTWLALVAPAPIAYTVFVAFHLLVAALGTARLATRLGAGRLGGVLAALLFVLSGPVQSSLNLWHHFAGLAWMPWVLLGVDRVIRAPRRGAMLSLGVVAGLQILAGSADVCAMTLALAVGWTAVSLFARRRAARRVPAVLATLLASSVLAAGLTALLWWPASELLARSPREALPADIRTAWSLPPAGLLRLATPLDPARVPFAAERWRQLYNRPEQPFLWSLYLGLPALGLAAAGFLVPGRRARVVAMALGLAVFVAVAFSLGPHGPVYPIATTLVPPLKVFRYPTKALLAVALLAATLSGLGLGALSRGRLGSRASLWLGLALGAGGGLGAAAAARFGSATGGPFALMALAGGVVWVLCSRGRVSPRLGAVALAGIAVADLLAAHVGLNATAPPALIFQPPPTVARVDRDALGRLYVYDYHSIAGTAQRLLGRPIPYPVGPPPRGVGEKQFQAAALREYLVPPSAGLFGLEGSYDLDIRGLFPRALNDLTFFLRHVEGTSVHTRLLRLGAVATVLSLHDQGLEDLPLDATIPSFFPEAIRVRRVPESLPRSWVVGGSRVAQRRQAFEVLSGLDFEPAREVLLAEGVARTAAIGFSGSSRVARLDPDRVVLEVEASSPGFVVLADAFDPGWRGSVDGQPAAVRRANVGFRAVAVPAGRHVVEMVYRPTGVLIGLTVSAVSLLWILGLVAATRFRQGPGLPAD